MPSRTQLRPLLPYLWTFVPIYLTERLANYYFLGKDPAFYTISGLRLEVFIICTLAGSLAAGAFLRSFRLAVATQFAALASVFAGVFLLCDPRVCYSAAPDGLEPLRLGLFLGSVAVGAGAIGAAGRAKANSSWEVALIGSAGFLAVSWYPVVFTFAGAELLAPFNPWATLALLSMAAFSASSACARRLGRRSSALVPLVSLLSTFVVSAGMAWAYLGMLGYNVLAMATATAVGGGAGAAAASLTRNSRFVRSLVPVLLAGSVVLVLTMTLVVIPDAVSGVVPGTTSSTENSYSMGIPVYAGAYMDSPQGHSDGAGVTLSFAGTNASAIQSDNFLAGGIGIHSAGCCVDGIDYAYRFDLYLSHSGNESIAASGWEACDDNVACGGHSWKVLLISEGEELGSSDLGGNVTLRMSWNDGEIRWSYAAGEGSYTNFTAYRVPAAENHDFNTGVSGGVSLSSEKAAYFFQFGIMSRYPIGHGGWKVSFSCPSTLAEGRWTCIPHAGTLLGDDSYWKVIWRWGEDYPNISVGASRPWTAAFAYSSTNATGDLQALW